MKKDTLTFKKQTRKTGGTGLLSVGYPNRSVNIKLDGEVVGTIVAPNWKTEGYYWRILFAVGKEKTPSDPSPFKWVSVNSSFDDEQSARQWVKDNAATILSWGLHAPWKDDH
jgi:hypothetical protein